MNINSYGTNKHKSLFLHTKAICEDTKNSHQWYSLKNNNKINNSASILPQIYILLNWIFIILLLWMYRYMCEMYKGQKNSGLTMIGMYFLSPNSLSIPGGSRGFMVSGTRVHLILPSSNHGFHPTLSDGVSRSHHHLHIPASKMKNEIHSFCLNGITCW